ncbi:hypothetical protein ACFXAF_09635 [Kitasatospora sp. NPDC059463]|uniref:hypothetical protein n=1 Tax=unclassified Kitasatospora TaxID=2633591 RepID=UPI003692B720
MTEPEFPARDAPDREAPGDREVADELRVLLQLAPPHLSAPEDRMERVLARAARTRRRRRRAALAGGLAVGLTAAVLAAAPALAPAPGGSSLHPAASGPAGDAVPSGGASPSTPPGSWPDGRTGDGLTIRFTLLDDIAMDVPFGWYGLTALPGSGQSEPLGYLSSQQLAGAADCPRPDNLQSPVCITAGVLADEGVVIALRVIPEQNNAEKLLGQPPVLEAAPTDKDCVLRGGTQQLRGFQALLVSGRAELVQLTACLRLPSSETLTTLKRTVTSIRPAEKAPSASPVPVTRAK